LFVAVWTTFRTLLLPLMGWDTLSYHGVKSALWVQTGGWCSFYVPGVWEYYRTYFGGGESYTAWSMLFLHHDLFAGIPDAFFWGLLGLSAIGIGRTLGATREISALVALGILFSYVVVRYIGSGYNDTCGAALYVTGVLFMLRYLRTRAATSIILSAAALGLSAAVKANFFFAAAVLFVVILAIGLRKPRLRPYHLLLCVVAFSLPVLPWLIHNFIISGYPFGCVPLSLGPLNLGSPPRSMGLLLHPPGITPYRLSTECNALWKAMRLHGPTVFLLLLAVPGLVIGIFRLRSYYLVISLAAALILAGYFSPAFSGVRIGWAGNSARYLLAALVLLTIAGIRFLPGGTLSQKLLRLASVSAMAFGMCFFVIKLIYPGRSVEWIPFILAVVSYGTLVRLVRHPVQPFLHHPAAAIALIILLYAGGSYALMRLKDSHRILSYQVGVTDHEIIRYWVPGLAALEKEPSPRIIAGCQRNNILFWAALFGGHLENRVLYVSPYRTAEIVSFNDQLTTSAEPCFQCWLQRLRDCHVTHIFSFAPGGIELQWIQEHPDLFYPLAGKTGRWGVFRFTGGQDLRLPSVCHEPTS